ncbi:MAG: hypothetical protein HUJ55_06360 [Ileibacterium sp.]|nr:hypothetical protein [Ileibacterium sp.]
MAKLSRTNKYQELRDQLDEETTAAQTVSTPQIKLTRSETGNAIGHAKTSSSLISTLFEEKQSGVIDELVDEVKQYNIDNGERSAEDTQMNIFRTLDEEAAAAQKRKAHLETMEANDQDQGGTTMNMNAISIEQVSRPVVMKPAAEPEPEPVQEPVKQEVEITYEESLNLGQKNLFADEETAEDNLELFDLGVDDFDQTRTQEIPEQPAKKAVKPKLAKELKINKKKVKAIPEQVAAASHQAMMEDEDEEEYEETGGKAGNIIMIVLILLLLGAIGYTIYLISKIGIL